MRGIEKYLISDLKICRCFGTKVYDQSIDILQYCESRDFEMYDYRLNMYLNAPIPKRIQRYGVSTTTAGDIFESYQYIINTAIDTIMKQSWNIIQKKKRLLEDPNISEYDKKWCETVIESNLKFLETKEFMSWVVSYYKWIMSILGNIIATENNVQQFQTELDDYLKHNPEFVRCEDINQYKKTSGLYMLVLGNIRKIYIGQAKDIKQRIQRHWYDKEYKTNGIDMYGAQDTTSIYIYPADKGIDLDKAEFEKVTSFDPRFTLNKFQGGKLCIAEVNHVDERMRISALISMMSNNYVYAFDPGYESFKENRTRIFRTIRIPTKKKTTKKTTNKKKS